ncbi:MAG: hypothetical protein CBCREVIR_1992 [Candidatus Burkholderia crenata]|nr:MAG: hypothetical protein CBCREVIR_1992 [Candidatus Burkholderia crenata]
MRLGAQNRMPAAHPPKAPPFVALPAQPKIPQPLTSTATPTATAANFRRRSIPA